MTGIDKYERKGEGIKHMSSISLYTVTQAYLRMIFADHYSERKRNLVMYICSWTSCPNLKNAYTSWKTPLFLCTEKLTTCREDKLVSFISCRNLMTCLLHLQCKLERVIKNDPSRSII